MKTHDEITFAIRALREEADISTSGTCRERYRTLATALAWALEREKVATIDLCCLRTVQYYADPDAP